MSMRAIALTALLLIAGATAVSAGDMPTPKIPPPEFHVKVEAPEGTTEQDIAAGIAAENARRDPAAQEAARVAKEKAAADEAHHERVSKICDTIPEKSLENDASLRRMCAQ
jgi:hypothetical protein